MSWPAGSVCSCGATLLPDPVVARRTFNGIFRDTDWEMVEQCPWSPTAGWADAAGALQSFMQAAVDLVVQYIGEGAARLIFGGRGDCVGAETTDLKEDEGGTALIG